MKIRGYVFLYIPVLVFAGYLLYPYIDFTSDLFIGLSGLVLIVYNLAAVINNTDHFQYDENAYSRCWNYKTWKLFLSDVDYPMLRLFSIHIIIFILVQIHLWFDTQLTIKIK